MTGSHEGAWKKAQTQARSSHDVWGAGAEAVATGAGRARTESGKGKAQKVSWKKQARSKEVAYPADLVKFTSRKREGSLPFRAGLSRGDVVGSCRSRVQKSWLFPTQLGREPPGSLRRRGTADCL